MIMECQTTNSKTLEIWNNGVKSIIHIPISMGTVEPVMALSVPVSRAVPSPLAKVQIGEGRPSKHGNTVEIVINDDPCEDDLNAAAETVITEPNSPQAALPQAQVKHNFNIQPASTTTTNTIDFRMSTQIVSSQYPVSSSAPSLLSMNVSREGTSSSVGNSSDSAVKNIFAPPRFNIIARHPVRSLLIQNPGSAAAGPRGFFGICPRNLQVDPQQQQQQHQQQQSIRLRSVQQQHPQVQFQPIQKYLQQFQPFPQQIQQLQQQIKHLPQYVQQMPEDLQPVSRNSHQIPQYIQQQMNYGHRLFLDSQQATASQFNINTIHHHPPFPKDGQSSGNVSLYLNNSQWLQLGQQSQQQQQGNQPIRINFSSSKTAVSNNPLPPALSSPHTVMPSTVLTSNFVERILQPAVDGVSGNVKVTPSGHQVSPVSAAKKSKKKDVRMNLTKTIQSHLPPSSLLTSVTTNEIPDLLTPIPRRSSLDDDSQLDTNPKTAASSVQALEENDSGVASVEGKKGGSPSSDLFSFSTEEIGKDQEIFFTDAVNTFNKSIEEGDILKLLDGLLQEDETEETAPLDTAVTAEAVDLPKPSDQPKPLDQPKLSDQMSAEKAQANLAFVKSIKGREALEAARQARNQKRRERFERSSDEKSSGSWAPEDHIPESNSSWDSEHSVTMGKKSRRKKPQHVSETKCAGKSSKSYHPTKMKKYKLRSQDKNGREESCSSRSSSLTSLRSSITSSSVASSSYSSTPSLPLSSTNSTKSSCASSNLSRGGNKTDRRKAILNKLNESKKKSTNIVIPAGSVAESERLPDGDGIKIRIKIRSPTTKNPPVQPPHAESLKRCFVNLEKLNIDGQDFVNLKKSDKKILCCEKSSENVAGVKKSTRTSRSSDEECVVKRPVKRRKRILLTSDESG